MNCSYDNYRVFYYAAKSQSFTQAANILATGQPNITRTIKRLEADLGCKLFTRSNRGVQLTPEGKKLYAHIALAFAHIQAGEAEIASNQSLQSGIVTVATSEIALRCCLLPILKAYRAKYSGVRIRVSNHSTPQAVDAVKNGLADFAVLTAPRHLLKTLQWRKIMEIQEFPVAGAAFSFLREKRLTLEELSRYPLIGLGPHAATFDFYSQLFSEQGLTFRPDIEASSADQILPMVKGGLGIGFVPEFFAQDDILAGNVFALALEHPVPKRSICLLKQENQPLSIAARELERLILTSRPGRA